MKNREGQRVRINTPREEKWHNRMGQIVSDENRVLILLMDEDGGLHAGREVLFFDHEIKDNDPGDPDPYNQAGRWVDFGGPGEHG